MEIECQGCYYTLCSFVCLTEDLSEILQFLWKHGCLRRTYLCEKCGRKCAIGDKDLFFRCNRNTIITQKSPNLSIKTNIQLSSHQMPSQMQSNRNDLYSSLQTHGGQLIVSQPSSSDDLLRNLSIPSTAQDLVFSNGDRLQHPGMLTNKPVSHETENLTLIPNLVLNNDNVNQSSRILTVIDSRSQTNHKEEDDSTVLSCRSSNVFLIPVLQANTDSSNKSSSLERRNDLLSSEPNVKIQKKLGKSEGKAQKKRCNFKVSMKKGTFFEKSKLPIDTVCKFVVFWCCMKQPTQEFLRNELSLATRTVVDWSTACREICIHWAKSVSEKIGGDGVIVQVDEVKILDIKDSKQNDINKYSFWGMEKDKEKGKIFIVPVPACDSWSLLNVINDWILPGSIIVSNCWKAYNCLKLQEFVQQTVVQSKTFVHPQNSGGQHNFEGKGDETGVSGNSDFHMPKFGTRRSHHLGDLAEFMFKRRYSNHLERMHAFFKQISMAYPLH